MCWYIVGRAVLPLINHFVDRSHHWRDRFFFVPMNALGPVDDPDHPPPNRWALLNLLKSRNVSAVPNVHLNASGKLAHETLVEVFYRGPVDFNYLGLT